MGELVRLGPWQVAGWWAVAVVGGAWCWIVFGGQHFRLVAERDLGWWLWHWFSGGPLEVHRVPAGPRAGARAGIGTARTLGTVAFFAVLAMQTGTAHDPAGALVHGAVGTAVGTAGTWLVVFGTMLTAHRLMWVRPLHYGIARAAAFDVDDKPRWYLTVPRDRSRDGVEFVVGVAREFQHTEPNQKKVITITRAHLDLTEDRWSAHFETKGRHNYCVFRAKEPMPETVLFSDPKIRKLIDECSPTAPLFGLTRGGQKVVFDIDSDSPHLLLSASTGAGKSWTLHMLAAQLMAHGAEVVVADLKRNSHEWIRHIAGIRYVVEIEDIHDLFCDVYEEVMARYRMHDHVDTVAGDPEPEHRRLIIICEEMNSTAEELQAYWAEIRSAKDGDPTRSPAVAAMRKISNMGRKAKTHLFAVFQQANANSIGGGAARENFSVRMLAGDYSKNTWNMLVPQIEYTPGKAHKGWAMVCQGPRAIETQFVKMTPQEARQLIIETQGYKVAPKANVAVAAHPSPLGESPRHVADARQPEQPVELVTLWQASTDKGRGLIPMKYRALGKARDRDKPKGIFPTPVIPDPSRPQYDLRDLRRWHALRSPRGGDLVDVIDVDEVTPEDEEPVGGTEGPESMEARRA